MLARLRGLDLISCMQGYGRYHRWRGTVKFRAFFVSKNQLIKNKKTSSMYRLIALKKMKLIIRTVCFALLASGIFIFSACSSPGKRVARALCECYEREIRQSGFHPDSHWSNENERNVYRCFDRKLERHWRHIERNYGRGNVVFKHPRHQREFDEAVDRCESRITPQSAVAPHAQEAPRF